MIERTHFQQIAMLRSGFLVIAFIHSGMAVTWVGLVDFPSGEAGEIASGHGLDLLPKVISERPSLREPSARRDEGVDEHPQPKNNAAIGFRRPELEATSREAASSSNSQSFSFRKGLLANGLTLIRQCCDNAAAMGRPEWLITRPDGFHWACENLQPARRWLVHSGFDRFPHGGGVEAIDLRDDST